MNMSTCFRNCVAVVEISYVPNLLYTVLKHHIYIRSLPKDMLPSRKSYVRNLRNIKSTTLLIKSTMWLANK